MPLLPSITAALVMAMVCTLETGRLRRRRSRSLAVGAEADMEVALGMEAVMETEPTTAPKAVDEEAARLPSWEVSRKG